jgi:cytochrome b6-f complex iron-sulfur subunit
MARLPKPRLFPEASSRFRIGRPEEFPPGVRRVLPERNVRIVSTASGVAAVSMVCTHLGCIVSEAEKGFICACHGSRFDESGGVLGGPAPRGLRWLEVSRAADGSLLVDTRREVSPGVFYAV